jgi:CMP/dCMP kinase
VDLQLAVEDGRVVVDDTDVTRAVRTPEIDKAATAVARMPKVREILVERQRALARGRGVVMEGRDIGTVVFPTADVKIYLDASPEERARRRAADPAHGGGPQELAAVATALAARDKIDTTRAVSPLMVAPDAVVVDTTDIPADAVLERVMRIVADRKSGSG